MNNRFLDTLDGKRADGTPFVPAIYEHKAWFVGSSPSHVCRDADLFVRAVCEEYSLIRPDAVTVGIDPYNVEAEAVGSPVRYDDEAIGSIPSLIAGSEVLAAGGDVATLRVPDPRRDGRMPLLLEVASRVHAELGKEVPVRAAVSGPFSLAAGILGAENLLMATVESPSLVRDLLTFCVRTIRAYASALLGTGCGVVIFDSQASPNLISPRTYRSLVAEATRTLVADIRASGARHVPLIIGGDTTPILPSLLETGANNLLCDFGVPLEGFASACHASGRAFRRNIDPRGFLTMSPEGAAGMAEKELRSGVRFPGFILGTGVVPYGTPSAVLVAMREIAHGFAATRVDRV